MIKNWLVRGDTHGQFTWMCNGCLDGYKPEETAIIILGDAGFDFYLNKIDERKKKEVDARGYYIYWVRGNHEARPQDVAGYEKIFDQEVHGVVYCDPRFPHLRAFLDYGFYQINDFNCYVIGGAYSVDKNYRLARNMMTEETNDPKKTGWFANEQLSQGEMHEAFAELIQFQTTGKHLDFIFSHTCPYDWEPRDLFLSGINQSTVDNTMELWMNDVKDRIRWNIWLWAHYHVDRIERPHCEIFYNDIENLDVVYKRWIDYDNNQHLDWWLEKSPKFYMT